MNKVQILDCTLRDGGYCNGWSFGYDNIKKIIKGLVETNVDIIECGFLTDNIIYEKNESKFTELEQIREIVSTSKENGLFVAMVNYGEYDIEKLPSYDGQAIDGIRVAFHKKDMEKALEFCLEIKKKGYKVFVQPMVSMSYSDQEFLELIAKVNTILPYAFYIVDSFGMMKQKDLARFFCLVDNNLSESVCMGFHSHNNLQLAYSNAQFLVEKNISRHILIDTSIYGMGRGAGNLNTELFIQYLNERIGASYDIKPVLMIIDEIINDFYQRNYWGYSLPNYISAVHNAHPNYAGYLDDKKTLTVEAMNEIFGMMDEEKKYSYDKLYIEGLYTRYLETGKVQELHEKELAEVLYAKRIILIAPGKSSYDQKERIISASKRENTVVISVNFDYLYTEVDYIFLSNLRRYRELDDTIRKKCIVTSNIPTDDVYIKTRYIDLVNKIDAIKDNAGMMAIKFLLKYGVDEILLAGFDGYSHDVTENYAESQMEIVTRNSVLDTMNDGMTRMLREYSKMAKISFLTDEKHVII